MIKDTGYVISVGAGKNQYPLIAVLKRRKYNVVGFDLDIQAIGRESCAFFSNISTWDADSAIQWLSSLSVSFIGVGSFSYGNALFTQQKIARYFQLPAQIQESSMILNNKQELRQTLSRNGYSTLEEYSINVVKDHLNLIQRDRYIIKPKLGGSSRDIQILDRLELERLITNKSLSDDYIIQEFLQGQEYRVSGIIQNNKIKFIALMEKENYTNTFFTGRLKPVGHKPLWSWELINNIFDKFQITNAAFKIDLICNETRHELIEIDFGIPGDYFETFIAPYCYGFDYINSYIDLIIGKPLPDFNFKSIKYSCFDYIYNCSGNTLLMDYNKVKRKLMLLFDDFKIIPIKEDQESIGLPTNNLDAMFGIIHNNKQLSNEYLNSVICETLS